MPSVCRACLEICDEIYPIKGKLIETEVEIIDMLSYLTYSKVEIGEYPSAVCVSCFKSIQIAYNFLLQYNKSQEKLRISDVKQDIIETDNTSFIDDAENYFEEKISEEETSKNDIKIIRTKKQGKVRLHSIEYLCIGVEHPDESIVKKVEVCNIASENKRSGMQLKSKKYYVNNVCPVCKQNVNEFHELIQHLSQSHKDNMFCCTFCKRKGKYSSKQYVQHLTKNHVFYCIFCKKRFASYATLYYHLKVKHAKNKSQYKCDQCNKTYPIKSLMTNHKKTHILGEKYLCNQCGAAFQSYKSYNHHKKKHDGTWNVKKYKCEICEQTFALRFSLRRHMFKHSEEDNFLCNKCGKGFRTYDTYNYHRKTHDNTRNHVCSICGQAFLQAVHLKDHMEKHTKVKNYRCEICDKEYSGSGSLRKHSRIYHSSIKMEEPK